VLSRHGIGGSYVFLPNQFWRHKNHVVVIEALRLLKQRGCPVQVVASGLQRDMRDPSHFPAVEKLVASADVGDSFRMLGVIPYADLMTLMGNAAAVLNPSLFEGWSTTVEESRAMGVPLLLSDIAVHREQMGDSSAYFAPHDAEALAALLSRFPPDRPHPDDGCRRDGAQAHQLERLDAFADRFIEATERAIASHHR
jgi:glycosyltransferase involved in cell wall biosynthesis